MTFELAEYQEIQTLVSSLRDAQEKYLKYLRDNSYIFEQDYAYEYGAVHWAYHPSYWLEDSYDRYTAREESKYTDKYPKGAFIKIRVPMFGQGNLDLELVEEVS